MTTSLTRRSLLGALTLAAAGVALPGAARAQAEGEAELVELEKKSGGRLGVAVLDTGSGKRLAHRADERFPMCSTFKLLAAAAVLARVDRGSERLDRRVEYAADMLVDGSPVTKDHVGSPGLTVAQLCRAAVTVSDNTAANLLLKDLGGPAGLTDYARSIGDLVTRLDRIEPELNEAAPGDPRDTTAPSAILGDLEKIVLGDALSAGCRAQIKSWLMASTTGLERLRAGMPRDWLMGDKTGTGNNGVTNDVGVVWPPSRRPIVVAAYLAESPASVDERNVIMKEIGRIVATRL
ncbi:MAG: class A beta-lactamase [Mesorhizobium sp.]|jgi:beta-lactamase class A